MSIFKSRTFWMVVVTFLLNGVTAIHSSIPSGFVPVIDGILGILTVYFHINPSQAYNAVDTTGATPSV